MILLFLIRRCNRVPKQDSLDRSVNPPADVGDITYKTLMVFGNRVNNPRQTGENPHFQIDSAFRSTIGTKHGPLNILCNILAGTAGILPALSYSFGVAAFFAMYSTTYTVIDGFSRAFAETLSQLFGQIQKKSWARLYWGLS